MSQNDVGTIVDVLRGCNPQGRVYAFEAVISLQKEGKISLSQDQKSLLRTVYNLEIPILTCHGCIVSSQKAQEIFEGDPAVRAMLD